MATVSPPRFGLRLRSALRLLRHVGGGCEEECRSRVSSDRVRSLSVAILAQVYLGARPAFEEKTIFFSRSVISIHSEVMSPSATAGFSADLSHVAAGGRPLQGLWRLPSRPCGGLPYLWSQSPWSLRRHSDHGSRRCSRTRLLRLLRRPRVPGGSACGG